MPMVVSSATAATSSGGKMMVTVDGRWWQRPLSHSSFSLTLPPLLSLYFSLVLFFFPLSLPSSPVSTDLQWKFPMTVMRFRRDREAERGSWWRCRGGFPLSALFLSLPPFPSLCAGACFIECGETRGRGEELVIDCGVWE